MDDSCAVCADDLEWVAYGPCNHRDVCSTCVARLRFICDDRRCCICTTGSSVVFVTKAMGDYTKMIGDFSKLPSEPREGRVAASLWYHEDTQAFFDDAEHYKMIKAMCRLSCSVCDNEEQPQQQEGGYKRCQRFKDIGHLKGHLSHQHKLSMCDLCLEGRKVFICEQKLYTRTQLNQHKRTGDSVVDGTESERGGFSGHPRCEFCRTSFYGESELYRHMTNTHDTCHLCQRQNPGHYEYFRNYDDLESHFRQKHHLCEDEACLEKKFIVFQTPEELKKHNALEHGGRMSRSQRNAALQIPTSFSYRSNTESGYHRGRRRSFLRDTSADSELSMAIERSLTDDALSDPSPSSNPAEHRDGDPLVQSFESLSTSESETSRYRQAVSQSSTAAPLEGSSFPPLSTPSSSRQRSQESQNTMAARIRRQNRGIVLNVAQPRSAHSAPQPAPVAPAPRPMPVAPAPQPSPAAPAPQPSPAAPAPRVTSAAPVTPAPRPATATSAVLPAPATPAPRAATTGSTPWPSLVPLSGSVQNKKATVSVPGSSSYARSLHNRTADESGVTMGGSWASRNTGGSSRLNHSSSAPNLVERKSFDPVADFPPVSAAQSNRSHSNWKSPKTDDVQTANKTLVERMRAALDFDVNKFSAFKEISQEYRQNLINTWEYLEYVKQFELTDLIPDMARLCPDVRKQKELLEAYDAIEKVWGNSSSNTDKGKKAVDSGDNRSQESLADNVINTVRSLQSQIKPSEEVEVLEKDGYRASREKATIAVTENTPTQAAGSSSGRSLVNGVGGGKQKKKTSKFHRLRLGEEAAVLDIGNSSSDTNSAEIDNGPNWPNPSDGQLTRGVWRSGGGQRLFAK